MPDTQVFFSLNGFYKDTKNLKNIINVFMTIDSFINILLSKYQL